MISVIIADDHTMLVQALSVALQKSGELEVTGEVSTLKDTFSAVEEKKPDVLLLDIALQDGDGLEALPKLKKAVPEMKIIMLTMYAEAAMIECAIEKGADGYVLKNGDGEELLEAIKQVAAGNRYISKAAEILLQDNKEKMPQLTKREHEILELLVEGMTMKEIADKLCLAFETVHSYTKALHQKFDVNNIASLVKKAIEWHIV